MNAVLVTGASGFLGGALVERLRRNHRVYGLSRHPPAPAENLVPMAGDILKPNLGLETKTVPKGIHCLYHLAAIHSLGEDKDGSIWATNVEGTKNVLNFCEKHDIPHLFFCSTAYTVGTGRNVYEKSKVVCERLVKLSDIPKKTIFKPSIVLGTEEHPYPGHFSQFVLLMIKVHQRAEIVRRKLEGTLRLPVLEPVFRIKGNAEGTLNMLTVDAVADAMASIEKEGTFWLTNPNPPILARLVDWVGELIMVNIKMMAEFKPTPIEAQFMKMVSSFEPYLQGDDFSSDLKECPIIDKAFIHDTIKRSLLHLT